MGNLPADSGSNTLQAFVDYSWLFVLGCLPQHLFGTVHMKQDTRFCKVDAAVPKDKNQSLKNPHCKDHQKLHAPLTPPGRYQFMQEDVKRLRLRFAQVHWECQHGLSGAGGGYSLRRCPLHVGTRQVHRQSFMLVAEVLCNDNDWIQATPALMPCQDRPGLMVEVVAVVRVSLRNLLQKQSEMDEICFSDIEASVVWNSHGSVLNLAENARNLSIAVKLKGAALQHLDFRFYPSTLGLRSLYHGSGLGEWRKATRAVGGLRWRQSRRTAHWDSGPWCTIFGARKLASQGIALNSQLTGFLFGFLPTFGSESTRRLYVLEWKHAAEPLKQKVV